MGSKTEALSVLLWGLVTAAVASGAHAESSAYDLALKNPALQEGTQSTYQAENPANDLRLYFSDGGVQMVPYRVQVPVWWLDVRLAGFGSDGRESPAGRPQLRVSGSRIEYDFGGLTQRYVNTPTGLELGFVVGPPSEGQEEAGQPARLVLDLAVRGSLTPRILGDGTEVGFSTSGGQAVLHYRIEDAADAAGREVRTRLSIGPAVGETTSGVRIVLEAVEPSYPIVVRARVAADVAVPGSPAEEILGEPTTGEAGITETVAEIQERDRHAPPRPEALEIEAEEERGRPTKPVENPLAPAVAQWPPSELAASATEQVLSPQTVGTTFRAIRLSESGFIPPDGMGDVGPTQILAHVNGRIKVFNKAGTPGTLNATDTSFWNSVRNGQGTTDPEVRYDRISGRWFLMSVNLANANNRVMIAVSSGPTVTATSSFTFFFFQLSDGGGSGDTSNFCDYPSLGVDANALYIGCNMFSSSGPFSRITAYVVRKSSVTGGGPIVVTAFRNIAATAGPFSPRGVDNDDPTATQGYFVGPDISSFSLLQVRRVSNPGATPTLSGNLSITVPTTAFPIAQPASGSTTSLDASDDRLFMAAIRKNKITGASTLWTAHNIEVNASCVGSGSGNRNGARWYEIGNLTGTPAIVQSGTLCDSAASNTRGYIYPTVAQTGQGHMALGSSFAAANQFAGVAASGRLRTDASGSTQAFTSAQAGLASYNIVTGGFNRWGDYSFTDVDPNDDQTVWIFQQYADTPANNWAIRAIQLKAPPPATPVSASPSTLCQGQSSVSVTVTGSTFGGGAEFFDPGPDTGGPGYANHIAVSVTGGVIVNAVTFTDPTHVTLNLNTTGASTGAKNVTVTNPDSQQATGNGLITVNGGPTAPTASNNGPICEGATLQLTASTVAGATYGWTGPGGFSSSQQNPTIPGATTAASGTYSVTVTVGGCTSSAATTPATVIADAGACNDGDLCSTLDTCNSGTCTGTPVTCTAQDACHAVGTCNSGTGQCSNPQAPDGTVCEDSNACTQTDECQSGVCTGLNPVVCAASDPCHVAGTCDPGTGQCSNPQAPDDTACNDANNCTQTDTCQAGACTGANPVVCAASDPCHLAGTCDPGTGQCSDPQAPDDTACDDVNECTQTDACQSGVCTGTNPVVCAASDPCHIAGTCDPFTGTCSNPEAPDDTACNDANACTQTDACQAGVCTGTDPIVCAAGDACHPVGTCDPRTGRCSNPQAPNGTACDDEASTTCTDVCQDGICEGTPVAEPPEIDDSLRLSKAAEVVTLDWTDAPGPYNVYRGSNGPGTPWQYDQTCLSAAQPGSSLTDSDTPTAGDFFYYLVSRVDQCRESVIGRDSNTTPEPNDNPCN